jgi:hypothetical protein
VLTVTGRGNGRGVAGVASVGRSVVTGSLCKIG